MSQLGTLTASSANPAGTQGQASPYQIGGSLNFGTVPGLTDYQGAYANALNLNQQNYANILGGYQNIMGNQQAAQQNIQAGYGALENQVLGGIQGIGASQSQAIQDVYAQQSGNSAQQMINSGLGNTTVQQSVQRGNVADEMKAQTALANQLAQLQAGYQTNIGMAGLNYANQANMQNTGLGSQQLGFMNSVNSPYPNAAAYGQLAMQQGYANQAKLMYGQMPKGMGAAGGGGTAAGVAAAKDPMSLLGKLNTSTPAITYGSTAGPSAGMGGTGAGTNPNNMPGSVGTAPPGTQSVTSGNGYDPIQAWLGGQGNTYTQGGAGIGIPTNIYGQQNAQNFGPPNPNNAPLTDDEQWEQTVNTLTGGGYY